MPDLDKCLIFDLKQFIAACEDMMMMMILILIASLFSAIYCVPAASAVNNEVLINEIELNPAGTDSGGEKVELYNPSNSSVDISGWTISSTEAAAATVVISEGMTLSPKDYLIIGRRFTAMAR